MKLFEKEELKILGPFYLENLISTIFFLFPLFEIVYFISISLSLTQAGFLVSAWFLGSFLFEVPTGSIADIYGRKFSVLLGYFLTGIFILSVFFTTNFYLLLIIFFLLGAVSTFISGAYEAWIVDNIKFHRKEKLIHNFYVKRQSILNISFVLAGIISALLVKNLGLSIIWISTSAAFLVSGLILIFVKEEKLPHKKEARNIKSVLKQTKDSTKYSLKHKVIFILLLTAFILSFSYAFKGNIIWQPLLKARGIPIHYLGYIYSLSAAIGIFAPFLANPILKKIGSERSFLAIFCIIEAIIISTIIFTKSWIPALIIWLALFALWDTKFPILGVFFQKYIPSKKRATITSLNSMIIAIGALISAPLAGFLAERISLELTMLIGAFFTLIAGILYFKIKR